jgi:import inner membrane translocase subunit TIM50
MARNNRPNQHQPHGHKKPIDFSRPPGVPHPSHPTGVSPSFTPPSGAQNSEKHAKAERSASSHQQRASGVARPSATERKEEFPGAGPSADIPDHISQNRPLPDLTQGIPSTLEYETTGSSRASPLNLAEAEEGSGQAAGGGRGKGELPASAYISSSEKKRAKAANIMYAMFAVIFTTGTIYLGRNWETEEEELEHKDAPSGWGFGLMWNRARARLRDQLNYYNEPAFRKLLPDPDPLFERPYTLVLSMEDMLIHSEWTREHGWRMAKRPGVDYFLRYLSQYYELVIFTSQPSALADPVIRKLDPYHIVTWPLFREATLYEKGEYIKVCPSLSNLSSKIDIGRTCHISTVTCPRSS